MPLPCVGNYSYYSSNQVVTIEDSGAKSGEMLAPDEEENRGTQKDLGRKRTAANENEEGQGATSAPWRVVTIVGTIEAVETRVGDQRRTRAWP